MWLAITDNLLTCNLQLAKETFTILGLLFLV